MDIKPKYHNSAGRFLTILQAIGGKGSYEHALPHLFYPNESEIYAKDPFKRRQFTIKALGDLHYLYQQFCDDVEASDTNAEQKQVLMRGVRNIQTIIYPNKISEPPKVIEAAEASLLEFSAAGLPQDAVIDKEDFKSIRSSIDNLRVHVASSKIDITLRKLLLEFIRLSRDAIDRYEIHGGQGLKQSFKGMIGELSELHFVATEKEREAIKTSAAWKAMMAHLQKFDELASKVLKYRPFLEQSVQILIG